MNPLTTSRIRRHPTRPLKTLLERLDSRRRTPEVIAPGYVHGTWVVPELAEHCSESSPIFVSVRAHECVVGLTDRWGFITLHVHNVNEAREDITSFVESHLGDRGWAFICGDTPLDCRIPRGRYLSTKRLARYESDVLSLCREGAQSGRCSVLSMMAVYSDHEEGEQLIFSSLLCGVSMMCKRKSSSISNVWRVRRVFSPRYIQSPIRRSRASH